MVQIANISRHLQVFTEKDGNVVELAEGEARDVNIDTDNVNVVAKKNAQLIEVGGTATKAAKTARAAGEGVQVPTA